MIDAVEFACGGDLRPRIQALLSVRRSFLAAMSGPMAPSLRGELAVALYRLNLELAALRGWGHA